MLWEGVMSREFPGAAKGTRGTCYGKDLVALVNLQAVTVGFCHIQSILGIQRDRYRAPEIRLDLRRNKVGSFQMRR